MAHAITIKRIYAAPAPGDGRRVLVDRIWPRGVKREQAAIDEWLPAIAPSVALRKWFDHRPERWAEFVARYRLELADETRAALLQALASGAASRPLTLLYAARDETHNHARVIAAALQEAADSRHP